MLVRRARTADVPAIKAIVDVYAGSGRQLLAKELVTLYGDVQDFRVDTTEVIPPEFGGGTVGYGALRQWPSPR